MNTNASCGLYIFITVAATRPRVAGGYSSICICNNSLTSTRNRPWRVFGIFCNTSRTMSSATPLLPVPPKIRYNLTRAIPSCTYDYMTRNEGNDEEDMVGQHTNVASSNNARAAAKLRSRDASTWSATYIHTYTLYLQCDYDSAYWHIKRTYRTCYVVKLGVKFVNNGLVLLEFIIMLDVGGRLTSLSSLY